LVEVSDEEASHFLPDADGTRLADGAPCARKLLFRSPHPRRRLSAVPMWARRSSAHASGTPFSAPRRLGAAYVSKVAHETQKLDAQTPPCNGDYVPLYRVVGKIERMEIAAIQRYLILPTGIGAKQFMLRLEDAKWIVGVSQQYETTPTKEMFIVTSRACAATLAMAGKFTDAGRAVVSFGQEALQMVNLDASRSGGIQEIWASGAVK
jgi:hypothetical protein